MNASTSKPSDSFPGLMAIVTGASPRTMGIYYDVSYDRSLDPPAVTTGNGVAGGTCTAGATPTGTRTEYEEGIDLDQTKVNGGAPGASLTDGGFASIDSSRLPRNPAAGCTPVYPWNFVRVNTIFGVIHAAGGYTAWSHKHPAYSSVAGPGGHSLNDFYAPEINSTSLGKFSTESVSMANQAQLAKPVSSHNVSGIETFSFLDAHNGWARTRCGLYATADGGATWKNISPPSTTPPLPGPSFIIRQTPSGQVVTKAPPPRSPCAL